MRDPGEDLVPYEAWDHTHPDHDWWVNGRGWCYDRDCPDLDHSYGRPVSDVDDHRNR